MKQKYKFLLKRIFYYFYGEKFFKRLNYEWNDYPSRISIIQSIIDFKKYNDYLEIGCDKDENFSQIKIKNKTGVDPRSGGTLRMTSDEFFRTNKNKFEIIFLDGLHTYEQTIKDIKNSIKSLKTGGLIVVHDCLPKKIWNQIVPRMYGHWNGDVWKAIVEARTLNNVDTYTCIADHGLGIILNRPNKNILKLETQDFKNIKFSSYYKRHKELMNTISHNQIEEVIV